MGHSLGTLVKHAALTLLFPSSYAQMAPYLSKLELFVSICGPHLGQVYSGNSLVDVGFGFLKVVSNKGEKVAVLSILVSVGRTWAMYSGNSLVDVGFGFLKVVSNKLEKDSSLSHLLLRRSMSSYACFCSGRECRQ